MAATQTPKIRRSLVDLQKDYDSGNKAALEALMRAWKGIKELPPDDPRSFFMIGGYHGEPFRGKGEFDPNWWGGYCQHGTVLFPSWHRAYLWRLEKAGKFPKRVPIGASRYGYVESEIDAHVAALIAARDAAGALAR